MMYRVIWIVIAGLLAMLDISAHAATLSSQVVGMTGAFAFDCFAQNVGKKPLDVTIEFRHISNSSIVSSSQFALVPGAGTFVSWNSGGTFYFCQLVFDGAKSQVRGSWQLKDYSGGTVLSSGELH